MLTSMTLGITFLFLNHPLSFGLILLIQTILVALMTGMINNNFWFSYIIFLIMVGGMLVLFIYMTSIASNEKFKFSIKMMYLLATTMISILIIMMIMDNLFSNMTVFNTDLSAQENGYFLSMSKFINYPENIIIATLMVYLLITLIMVVKITNIEYGPLRQKF
uniref:NADH-ubiquinone oxidoreductase chain 6 n=1 Tax=Epipedocera atra TaxID=2763313 RepID=A0A7G7WQ95_9CUCU|nr:NADH dehydrogenase subunit 6 [Epipedocera atra]QNH68722.1 NADH dehydrogenase subunit 6 [Epipedocera atra]